ncbi:hypothetical protein [Pedobacter sp. Leaf176]|uniref:hypothetical protein n=1 Tax=Pedobacter sp. Leaf176 TaxID=1736286 RepID=UPI0007016AE1|nr:hypothetical protein [Pedobacter sp. Leaf176]KQR70171.1 hypothetical protein ASF92_09225 [Pedobacter sp. Leaf176]
MKKFIITICCLVLIQISGCGNDPEKHRESEVNTDTIDTTTVNQPSKISTSGTDTTTENSKKTAAENPKN